MDDAAKELAAVLDNINDDIQLDEVSESGSNEGSINEKDNVDDDVVDDDEDGLPDEQDDMSEKELLSLEESVKPIQLVLTKVFQFNS